MQTIRERLLATVGGADAFERSFNWRTFSPAKRADQAIADAEREIADALAILSAEGTTAEQTDTWLGRYIAMWAKYQAAGARTANWMITGPARFPVERNRKRMEIEHRRSVELSEFVAGVRSWMRQQARRAERGALIEQAATVAHDEQEIAGVRLVKNTTLDRVQMIFPTKPSAEERAVLKKHAFRWAPSAGAWQRQLTRNGLYAAEAVLKSIAA